MGEALPPIDRFAGEHAWLSNMHPCSCPHEGKVFASSEHLYQWLKTAPGWWQDRIFGAEHGKVAKALAANPKCPKAPFTGTWDDRRLELMEIALRSKFGHNADLRQKLIDTDPSQLIEGNYWHDQFYGVCSCRKCEGMGQNQLGQLLMKLRAEYIAALSQAA